MTDQHRSQFDTVVWDLDGTLVDSATDIAAAVNGVLDEAGLNPLPVTDVQRMIGDGAGKLLHRAFEVADGMEIYQADRMYESFLTHYRERCCVHTRFYPGIESVLNTLNKAGVTQGICTNKPHAITAGILRQMGIGDFFGSIIGGDSTGYRKPHALPLDTCIEALGKQKQAVLMVGDSAADVGAARASDVRVAVVPWGYSRSPVVDLGADYLIAEPQDLLPLVRIRQTWSR